MSRYSVLGALIFALISAATCAASAKDYGVGRAATSTEIAEWNIDVRPDGQGLPKGHGSVSEGQTLYDDKCASCHGTFGESNDYLAIAGGVGSLKSNAPVRTVGSKLDYATTLWDYINRAMPFPTPKTLTPDQVYAITAYVLNLSEIVPADTVLDQDSLPKVKMPNRDGFTLDHGMSRVDGKPDTHNTLCMKDCEKDVHITSQLPPKFTADLYGDLSDQFRGLATMRKVSNRSSDPAGAAQASPAAAIKLAQQYACLACHALTSKVVGPAFRDVATKYKAQADAPAKLFAKITAGGSGNWGGIPMPAQAQVPEADRKILIEWILAGAPE